MVKLILAFAAAGFLLLFAATAALAWLNWSEKLYMPMITALLVGTVTGFVSIFAGLQATSTSESFPTSVIVNQDTGLPLLVLPSGQGFERTVLRQGAIAGLVSQANAGKPKLSSDPMPMLLEALQYHVVRVLSEIGGGGWAISNVLGATRAQVSVPAPSADLGEYPRESLSSALAGNQFHGLPSETFWWSVRSVRVPHGTDLKLFHVPSSPASGVERRGVRLVKPLFFTVEIKIEPIGISGGVPGGLVVSDSDRSRIGTFFAKVSVSSNFEKLTSGNWRTEQYRQWAKWLSEQIHLHLSD